MLRDTVVSIIAERLNNRTDLNAAIIAEMQLAQETRLEQNGRFTPWFMLTPTIQELVTIIGASAIVLPDNFVSEAEEEPLWVQDVESQDFRQLRKVSLAEGKMFYPGTGEPKAYSFTGTLFTLYPTPDKLTTIFLRYNAKQASLATNIENAWLKYASDLMIAEVATVIAAQKMQNKELAAVFASARDDAWQRLFVMHESLQHTNREYSMGDRV